MANVKFNRIEFEKSIKITPEVVEKINLFGTPVESLSEREIEIEIYPNRPDLLSMQGFLRAIKSCLGNSKKTSYEVKKPLPNYEVTISPSVKNIRPFTSCAIVKNLKLTEEKIINIIDLQEKLHSTLGRNRKKVAIGVYPLEKIKLPIRYEARKPEEINFIPLDSDKKMNVIDILKKHPKGKEFAHLLKGFDKFPVFLDSDSKVLSVPPIINSADTGKITESTKDVFIECSGSNLESLKKSLNIVVTTLADMGGEIYQMNLKYDDKTIKTPDLSWQKIKLSIENTNKLLGLNLKEKDVFSLLSKMGIEYRSGVALVPPWRSDILHEVDLIEDIAIAYGYNNFIPEIPKVATIGAEAPTEKIKNKIADLLVGLGYNEISTYHLIKEREAHLFGLDKKIEVENSKTEYKILRPNLLIPALRILSENKDKDYPQNIFEIGTTFQSDKEGIKETDIYESEKLIIVTSPGNFTKAKQILNYLFDSIDIKYSVSQSVKRNLIEGRTSTIVFDDVEIGYFGEIHPEALRAWSIKMHCCVIEISLDKIIEKIIEKYS